MFERLQKKWKVDSRQLFLVLCVFAIGGSATGYFGKIIMNWLSIDSGLLWTIAYIIVVTLIWPLNVLLVSIPFGQFSFFAHYLRRMGSRIGLLKPQNISEHTNRANHNNPTIVISKSPGSTNAVHEINSVPLTTIAVFASGMGSNALKIIDHFRNHPSISVGLIACNKAGAGVLAIAEKEGIPTVILEKEKFFRGNAYVDELKATGVNFIVLAGFLWKIPQQLIDAFRNRIVNIHPALLPKYGGKGMYGATVHEAVIQAREKESGITIHYVDEHYDNGDIIFQARVEISEAETAESLAKKIHGLEHSNYPQIIEQLILKPNGS
jgi:formyltetrahydrofolate-dependent phosphoribosylglycinamide formyltransferase